MKKLVKQVNDKENYNEVVEEIYRLRELRQDVLSDKAEREGKKQRIGEMVAFLHEQVEQVDVSDEQLMRQFIEKITVYHDRLTVEFKSGVETDVGI